MQDSAEEEAGRAIVRDCLVNRLNQAGLRPRRGLTVADQAKVGESLVVNLAYMSAQNLATLSETILSAAAQPGPAMGHWPAEVLIRSWAEALQARPFSMHPIIASWLRSVEGPTALAGGYLVELLRWLRRNRRALFPADLAAIKRQANDMQGQLLRIRERIDCGRPWPDDRETLADWIRDEAEALQYVDDGNAGRAARAQADNGNSGVAA